MVSHYNNFVHLHVHSHYSLLDGLPRIDQLVSHVKTLEMPAVALTDHGALYGAVEFYKTATDANITPIIGVEAYVAPHGMNLKRANVDTARYHLPLLAETTNGYHNLLQLVTKSYLEGFYYKPRIDKEVLRDHAEGLIGFSGCLNGEIPQAILSGNEQRARELIAEYSRIFGEDRFFLEVQIHPSIPQQATINAVLGEFAREMGLPLIGTNDAHYLESNDADAQDILICIQTGKTVDDNNRMSMKGEDFSLLASNIMRERLADFPEAADNTLRIAERCQVELSLDTPALPLFPTPNNQSADDYVRKLCLDGIPHRYGNELSGDERKRIMERLDHELDIITKTGFASYFLIVQDFVNWAKNQHIAVGPGRGSAAGSLVSYLLNITDIDPLHYDLLFERFLDPNRNEMPDIDLDFADTRRDQVIDYVRERYGNDHVAQIITFGTLGARAAIRDVGRALGHPYSFCDQVAKAIPFGLSLDEALKQATDLKELYGTDPDAKTLVNAARKLEGVARHTSTHAAGVVITPKPLTEYTPLQYSGQKDRAIVTQYEMISVGKLGLLKMDFLGLTNLSIIERTLKIIERTRGESIDIGELPLDDRPTFELLQRGQTAGVFQLESDGMRRYLKKLRPTEFEDIIAMVALYRPGPLTTGMVEEYIERKHGRREITHLHPRLEPILRSTYGVLVYQEQLMQLARDLAGFTLSEADILRKAVGKKIKSLLDQQRQKLIDGMVNNDIESNTATRIWEFIEPFAQYGFNRSHSACYALIAYQTAYLKANYTPEFMAALMTSDKNDTETIAKRVEECRSMDIPILPPDINESMEDFTHVRLENDGSPMHDATGGMAAIRFGLGAIKNLGANVIRAIEHERTNGPFTSLADFLQRMSGTDINRKSLESIVKAGAMDAFAPRVLLLANLEAMLAMMREKERMHRRGQHSLFDIDGQTKTASFDLQTDNIAAIPHHKQLQWERQLLGLYLSAHPLDDYTDTIRESGALTLNDLEQTDLNTTVTVAGIIGAIQKITTKTGEPMLFVTLEDKTGHIDAVVFPRVLREYAKHLREERVVLMRGRLTERRDQRNILCAEIVPLERNRPKQKPQQVILSLPQKNIDTLLPNLRALLASLPRGPYTVTVELTDADGSQRRIETRHTLADPNVLKERLVSLSSEHIAIQTIGSA